MLKLILIASLLAVAYGQERPIISTTGGLAQGIQLSTGVLQPNFFAFKGIPYAEPPVGNLRFRNPVAHRGWSGTLDAQEHRAHCPSSGWFGLEVGGEENCLFLNVYTPSFAARRAVMVWIHGGSFTGGSGDSWIYGPDFLVNDGVVVVTLNYRLGVLGYLGTGDAAAQGNWGMKDIVEALRWVRNNIASFGGDPNQVTVFGESAGGVAIHYLMLSQMGLNLFQRAIAQSGTALVPWGFQPNPRGQAEALGRQFGLTWSSTQNLVDQLRTRHFWDFVQAQSGWLDMEVPRGFSSMDWVPCVEPPTSPEQRFLTADPVTLMRTGNFLQIPAIIGYTDVESLFMIREVLLDDTVMDQFIANPHFYAPRSFNLNPVTQQAQVNEVAQTFRNIYFNGQHPSQAVRFNWTQFNSDSHFAFGIDRTVRYHAARQSQPIFYYKFSMDGSLNMVKRLILLTDYDGAVHADDIFHLFNVASFPLPILPNNIALTVRRRMVRMWVNFAMTGNPTPSVDALVTARWERYTIANQEFMDIGETLVPSRRPYNGRLEPWHNFQNRFNPCLILQVKMLKLIFVTSLLAVAYGQERPIVSTTGGQLQGIQLSTGILQPNYFSFKGIPYAEPPVGNLRFSNPVPHRGWAGVRNAENHGNFCPSGGWFGMEVGGNEDCLFLNVYTPSFHANRPVMVWIHGGIFTLGSGDSTLYGPDFFVNEGVVVVTLNYRLGVLGFLSTGDGAAQGNWAMKDMVEALRWVRSNIASFGGDPNQVTVFGESAGGVAVHYLMLSQMGLNLFQRAISQSGTALVPWGFQPNPRAQAERVGRHFGLTWSSTQNLVDQLRTRHFSNFPDAQGGLLGLTVPRGREGFDWVPCVEPPTAPQQRFLTADPVTLMRTGNFLQIPAIIGYTSDESLFVIREAIIDPTVMSQFIANPNYYVPVSFGLNPATQQAQINEVAQTFRNIYFNGQHPSEPIRYNWTQFNTDSHFAFGIDRTVRYHAARQSQPIFYYKFSMDGSLNMLKRLMLLSDYDGAGHGDDLFHMWSVSSFPLPILPGNAALTVRRRMVRMWVNFAMTGNPTPSVDALVTARWERYTNANQEFMDIGENLVPSRRPYNGRMEPWHAFQNRFNPW